ncbi:MAG: response regulator transcription factor [Verrucomicrobiota bacterium]
MEMNWIGGFFMTLPSLQHARLRHGYAPKRIFPVLQLPRNRRVIIVGPSSFCQHIELKMRLLIVEDSDRLRSTVAMVLRESGYAVDEAADGVDGLWKAQNNPYDLIILDIMLPGLDGLSALRQLRVEDNPSQILILSAKGKIEDRVKGLRDGADDYLIKPFSLDELLARVEALCRRAYKAKDPVLEVESLKIDTRSKTVSCGENTIDLTPREYAILEYLVLRRGYVVSRTEIESHVYDDVTLPMSNVVDRSICSMRKKLEAAGNPTPVVQTKRGQGYIVQDSSS